MNRQRKVVITVTYNDLGTIVDTKAEELNLSAQPTIMRSIGELVGYTGEPCPNCGRLRVERYKSGLEICEKCNWCEQTKSYWLDGA